MVRTSKQSWLRAMVILAILGVPAGLRSATLADQPDNEIEGAWIVESVEAAGQPVGGLQGARLVLVGGKKTLTLPSGAVEKGTYTLDPGKTPKSIDATTEGRPETARGIYAVAGDKLTMCLSQTGRRRPERFATREGADLILITLTRPREKPEVSSPSSSPSRSPSLSRSSSASPPSSPPPHNKPSGRRAFRMGFTGFVYDISPEAVAASRKFVRENGDILAHHIEGVPWAEALQDLPFPKAMLEEWEGKKSATPPHGKVYLAISPGRGDLKPAEKALPIPAELRGKSYDDPLVKRAYLKYCRRSIAFFKPDYLAIGIEVNEIYSAGPGKWKAYADLHKHVYEHLKKEHPRLPVFASFTLHNLYKHRGKALAEFQQLMPYNDLVAVSYYPFIVESPVRLSALDWLTEQFDGFKKPYAMVETNDAAQRLPFPKSRDIVIDGSPATQRAYYERLLAMAQERRFVFVISFIHQDYDALWEKIKGTAPELFIAWRDCGFLDEKGTPRPAYEVWKQYLNLPLSAEE